MLSDYLVLDLDKWLRRIPRPERSGVTGSAMAIGLLMAMVIQSYPLESWCQLLPWGCRGGVKDETAEDLKRAEYHWLFFTDGAGLKSKNCVCRVEYTKDDGKIMSAHTGLSCSDYLKYEAMVKAEQDQYEATTRSQGLTTTSLVNYNVAEWGVTTLGEDGYWHFYAGHWNCDDPKKSKKGGK